MKKILSALFLLAAILLPAQDQPLVVRMVRHGQPGVKKTDSTAAGKKKNWMAMGLTPLGCKQAEITGQFLKKEGVQWSRVIASPQMRASETADIICGILGKTFTLEPRLREVGNPIPETLPVLRERFKNLAPDAVLNLTEQQRKHFTENNKQQGERGRDFIMSLFKTREKGPVLLVTHGNFMYTTTREMTKMKGKRRADPWNCGMVELKVWPDGRTELIKAEYPEVLPADLITDNGDDLHTNPWRYKFDPYPASRPDPVEFMNQEFGKFARGEKSSWRLGRRIPARAVRVKDGSVTLIAGKKTVSLAAPRIPLTRGTYLFRIKASGKGTGICRSLTRPYKLEFQLDENIQEHELAFSAKEGDYLYAVLEAMPGSELNISEFSFQKDQ